MCLYSKTKECQVAEELITVYKTAMLMESDKKGEVILSAYRAFRYIPEKEYRTVKEDVSYSCPG